MTNISEPGGARKPSPHRSEQLYYGGVPVPYTVSWTAEESFYLASCVFAGGCLSICQPLARGQGKPLFGKPHAQRQREAISHGLCDLCGKPLKVATKVSLSHARSSLKAFQAGDILQVEPLLHKACARQSMAHCPSLKRDLAAGTIMIRQVMRHRVQLAIMDEVYTKSVAGHEVKAVGHAKVQLLHWIDRDLGWLS